MANLDFKIQKRIKDNSIVVTNIKERCQKNKIMNSEKISYSEIRLDRYTPSLNQHPVEAINF